MTEQLVAHFGYVGIALILILGGLGLPIPEEAPIILAAILSKSQRFWWPIALGSCLAGVLIGDFIVYALGYFYGERVLNLRIARKFLSREREVQIKGYFHRHGFKILILGRFAVGFRTAAYLTAGILELPVIKLFLTDLVAASLSTFLMFGLGYFFAHWIETTLDQAKYWISAGVALAVVSWLLHRYHVARKRGGQRVGPKVLENEDVPLPPDDLHAFSGEFRLDSSARAALSAAPPPKPAAPTDEVDARSAAGARPTDPTAATSAPPPPVVARDGDGRLDDPLPATHDPIASRVVSAPSSDPARRG